MRCFTGVYALLQINEIFPFCWCFIQSESLMRRFSTVKGDDSLIQGLFVYGASEDYLLSCVPIPELARPLPPSAVSGSSTNLPLTRLPVAFPVAFGAFFITCKTYII